MLIGLAVCLTAEKNDFVGMKFLHDHVQIRLQLRGDLMHRKAGVIQDGKSDCLAVLIIKLQATDAIQTSFFCAIFANNSSRCVESPVPQLPSPAAWSCGSDLREKAACAPFIAARGELMAALASARWPLPMETPLNARFASSGE